MKLFSKSNTQNLYRSALIAAMATLAVGCGSSSDTVGEEDLTGNEDPIVLTPDSDEFSINAAWSDNKWISQSVDRYRTSSYAQGIQRVIFCLDDGTFTDNQTINAFADGIFGTKTRAAIEDFQEKRGITVDGTVGDETWAALQDVVDQGIDNGDGYNSHAVSGLSCDDEIQFYQDQEEDGGWMMARLPRSVIKVPFSIGDPVPTDE